MTKRLAPDCRHGRELSFRLLLPAKTQIENNNKIHSIDATGLLYFAKSIEGGLKF